VRGLLDRLAAGEVLVADGAMGTMLMARGLTPGACPEAIGLDRPGLLEEIAALFAAAGADLVQANTFGASPLKLALYGLDGRAAEINARAVEAARKGAAGRALVYGSVGPSGRLLEPYGDASEEAVLASFAVQVRALADSGVDAIVVETMTDATEAALAVRAAKDAAPAVPVVATMTFDRTPRGFFTIMGVTVERACRVLEAAGADAVGSNCGNGSDAMVEIAAEFRRHSTKPVAIQSNAGLPRTTAAGLVYPEGPGYMADRARTLIGLGVAIVGGCCGTGPEHVRAFREAVDRRGSA
jgi:5-methyltetrahydrofolate--homocysteine methyltransferase